jgi:exonuclease III
MRIVTWNVNSLTKTAPEAFPVAELAGAGYGAVHDSGGRWAGVAILARAGMCGIDREYRKGPKPSDHAPLMLDLAGAGQ